MPTLSSPRSPITGTLNLPLGSIFEHYTHLLLSSGAPNAVLHPALLPSEHCRPALDVVHWYTQHPSIATSSFVPNLEELEHVTVIGHGNVALDVARILLAPLSHLSTYDLPECVLEKLRRSRVRHVTLVGRRGPLEASFTTKELRELMSLDNTAFIPLKKEVTDIIKERGKNMSRQQTRLVQLLEKGSKTTLSTQPERSWSLEFFRSPTGIQKENLGSGKFNLKLAHMTLDESGRAVPAPSGKADTIDTDLVLTSLGYRADTWFNDSHVASGRVVIGAKTGTDSSRILKNVYASGWAANGARGVLASTMLDAHAVVDTILSDLRGSSFHTQPQRESTKMGESHPTPSVLAPAALEGAGFNLKAGEEVKEVMNPKAELDSFPKEIVEGLDRNEVVRYEDWKRVDEEEIRRGQALGKERERMNREEAKEFLKIGV